MWSRVSAAPASGRDAASDATASTGDYGASTSTRVFFFLFFPLVVFLFRFFLRAATVTGQKNPSLLRSAPRRRPRKGSLLNYNSFCLFSLLLPSDVRTSGSRCGVMANRDSFFFIYLLLFLFFTGLVDAQFDFVDHGSYTNLFVIWCLPTRGIFHSV